MAWQQRCEERVPTALGEGWLQVSLSEPRFSFPQTPDSRHTWWPRLFDLAYWSPSDVSKIGVPVRLQRCIGELLASAEPFDFGRREAGSEMSKDAKPWEPSSGWQDWTWPSEQSWQYGWQSEWHKRGTCTWSGWQPREKRREAQDFLESFCRRRELTRLAQRDLLNMDTFVAYDLVIALEVDKKDRYLQPADWSRIISSRVSQKTTAAVLDQSSIGQIDDLIKARVCPGPCAAGSSVGTSISL